MCSKVHITQNRMTTNALMKCAHNLDWWFAHSFSFKDIYEVKQMSRQVNATRSSVRLHTKPVWKSHRKKMRMKSHLPRLQFPRTKFDSKICFISPGSFGWHAACASPITSHYFHSSVSVLSFSNASATLFRIQIALSGHIWNVLYYLSFNNINLWFIECKLQC